MNDQTKHIIDDKEPKMILINGIRSSRSTLKQHIMLAGGD
jgi:hypothetical protein